METEGRRRICKDREGGTIEKDASRQRDKDIQG